MKTKQITQWRLVSFLAPLLLCVAGCGNPILRDAWITESKPGAEGPLVGVDKAALTAAIAEAETLIAGTASGEDAAAIPLGVHFVTGAEKAAYQAAIDAARAARDDGAALDLATASGVFTAAAAAKTGTKPGPAPILGVTAVSFDGAVYGDAQPEAKPITITNSGTGAAAISAVALSGDGKDDFTLGGSGDAVSAGGSIATRTVQPVAALAAGSYTATITVSYDGGAAATAQVSITVSKAAGGAVGTPGGDSAGTTITATALTVDNDEQEPEYAISTGDTAPDTGWQDSPSFNGLDYGVTYYVYARAGASANYGVGAAVRSAAITVGKLSQEAFGFGAETVSKTYGDGAGAYTATGGSGDGGISYAASGGDGAVSVDAASGAVSFLKAGTGYITATKAGDATYNAVTATLTVTVAKRPLTATATATGRPYNGTTEVTVTITPTNKVGSDEVSITGTGTADNANVGSRTVSISGIDLTGAAAGNYTAPAPASITGVTVTISKAAPVYTAPTTLSAFAGQTLADVALSGGFSWDTDQNPTTTAVGGVGDHTFKAKYTPTDTENYLVVEDIPVSIAVTAKTLAITVSLNLSHEVDLIDFPADGITLSRAGDAKATINATGYTSVKWYVDGDAAVSVDGDSITLNAGDYDVRNHQVTFQGDRDGVTYSKEIGFTVSK
ncbi:beta strand repeat-containing protein [Treponema primitia]|uniref:beta strand repeat-containing protein n=1 Tax=Treponema primitia TaxID=88058 RepID=UPI0002555186|nr:YDG domain-containing protein [Treponema primitia]